ncbi:hypothetical protein [Methylocapsa palsarum]|uniref:Uncharacterized protein n=1 Tax=Methylocapsa palsarum TaxID=1612308 RepID=A0A1I3VUN5_9HYPH|nr:hypothetical protein [Methylocapsa palsarum]SFJ98849.1 hypothetical protein SAMN05444581_101112 [Methylocapsa palsarum]
MAQHANPVMQRTPPVAIHADAPAEKLFITQYRCWTAGYSLCNRTCLNLARVVLQSYVTPCCVNTLYDAFHFFAFTMNTQAQKPIEWRPDACRYLCRDEYLALRLISSSQAGDFNEEVSAATDLLGMDEIHLLVTASRLLAHALKVRGFVFGPAAAPEDERSTSTQDAPPSRLTLH